MLPSLTLAFAVGLFVASFIPFFPVSLSLALLLAALGLTLVERRQSLRTFQGTAWLCCLLAGILYWFVIVERAVLMPIPEGELDVPRQLAGRIVAPVQQGPDRLVMMVRLDPATAWPRQPSVIRLTWRAPERLVFQGDRIRVHAKLRAPSGSLNPGGFDYAAYLERQGIEATATVSGAEGVEFLESGRERIQWRLWNQFDRWRGAIRLAAVHALESPALGLYLGVIVGERGYLDPQLRDAFMATGTVHLLSISGSHLGLVAILTFLAVKQVVLRLFSSWLLRLSRVVTPTRLAAAATVLPVTAYACLAGAETATIRSLIMVVVALTAKWCGYEQRMFHALSVAALIMLLHDPRAIYDISFQLSFVSVGAISWWLSKPDSQPEARSDPPSLKVRAIHWGKDAVVLSAVVTLATVPLVAYYFNQISWMGVFTNIVAVPVMGAVLVPLGLASAVGQSLTGGELPLGGLLQWSFNCYIHSIRTLSSISGAEWHVAAPSLPVMLAFYGCLFTAPLYGVPPWVRWISVSGLVIILSWWVWSPRWLAGEDRFRVTFLDVAQGDSAVVEFPDGAVVLIDGGTTYERFDMGRGVVGPFLWNQGIHAIDHVIATHPQLDHVGGLTWVLQHFTVRHFWGNGDTRDEPFYHRLQAALTARGLTEQTAKEGDEIVSDQHCRLVTRNPADAADEVLSFSSRRGAGRTLNNRSVVTELICGRHRILFTADVEQETLLRLGRERGAGPIEVVKVPHHGAASSLQLNWLDIVHPRYAVISVGRHNPYGHPTSAVVEAYASRGAALYRTDRDGAVRITGGGSDQELRIHGMREGMIQAVPLAAYSWRDEFENWTKLMACWWE